METVAWSVLYRMLAIFSERKDENSLALPEQTCRGISMDSNSPSEELERLRLSTLRTETAHAATGCVNRIALRPGAIS